MRQRRKFFARLVPREHINTRELTKALVEIAMSERDRKQRQAGESEQSRDKDAS